MSLLKEKFERNLKRLLVGESREDAMIKALDDTMDVYIQEIVDKSKKQTKKEILDVYKQSVWEFLVDHCEVENDGTLFFKFHASNRLQLEKRIYAREKGYKRNDTKAKEELIERVRELYRKKKYRNSEQLSSEAIKEAMHKLVTRTDNSN